MSGPNGSSGRVDEAIDSIAELERQAQIDVDRHQRWIERITRALGRPRSVYFVASFVAVWVVANLALSLWHVRPFDEPPFFWLQGIVGLAALLTTILILTTENRQTQIALRRDRLDLQINLLTERKVAKIIEMLDELRRDLPSVPTFHDPEVHELKERADPHEVVRAIEERSAVEDELL